MITKEEFNTLQDRGFNVIPIVKEISLTNSSPLSVFNTFCLLYTSDAADEGLGVDLGGRRIIKKK